MPVPASEAIASDIGHGALGLRDGLRPLADLLDASAGQRHVWVEARAGKILTGWAAHNVTGTWAVPVAETFDGVRRDVVGVRCGTEALTRVQSLAACEVTEGTFYYDPEALGQAARWDDGVTAWDSSTRWDQDPILYVHRLGGRPPTEVDVLGQLGIFWGSHGVWQPSMSATLLTDGGLELWASASDLTAWTEGAVGAGGGAIAQDGTDKAAGTYSCRIDGSINASGGRGISQGSLSGVGAATYRLAGYYRVAEDAAAEVEARFRVGYAGAYLQLDGRTTTAGTGGLTLARTAGYWRRFVFDFVCPADTSSLEVLAFAYNTAAGARTGSVWFDGLTLQRIHRFEFYEPRLTTNSLPPVEQGRPSASCWFEPMATALGSLSVANGNSLLEQLFAAYEWIGAEIILRVGGRLPDGGNELLADDLFTVFVGIADAPQVDDTAASLELTDARVRLQQRLPRRRYDDGDPRPMVLGFGIANSNYPEAQGLVPKKVGDAANGYGVYDVVDCADWPPGLTSRGAGGAVVVAYADEEAARRGDLTRRYLLSVTPLDGGGPDFSFDVVHGRLTILRDVQPIEITPENNVLDFNIGGGALVAKVTTDAVNGTLRSPHVLAGDIATALSAAAGATISVSYTDATHKFAVAKPSGTLQLLCNTGANKGTSLWPVLGFDCSTDKTGALGYYADEVVYTTPDQHVLRVGVSGYKDDASGTFTGTPSAGIERAADVLHFVLRVLAGVPASQVDIASFVAARSWGPDLAALVLLDEDVTVAEVVSWCEATLNADLQLEGGVYYLRQRTTSVPSDVLALQDRDFLSFQARYEATDYASRVRLRWHYVAEDGERWTKDRDVATADARFGAPGVLEVGTIFYEGSAPELDAQIQVIATEAGTKRRRFSVTAPGRALLLPVGQKVTLTRAKGLSSTGALSAVLCRIVAKRDAWASWASELQLIEVV